MGLKFSLTNQFSHWLGISKVHIWWILILASSVMTYIWWRPWIDDRHAMTASPISVKGSFGMGEVRLSASAFLDQIVVRRPFVAFKRNDNLIGAAGSMLRKLPRGERFSLSVDRYWVMRRAILGRMSYVCIVLRTVLRLWAFDTCESSAKHVINKVSFGTVIIRDCRYIWVYCFCDTSCMLHELSYSTWFSVATALRLERFCARSLTVVSISSFDRDRDWSLMGGLILAWEGNS